MAGQGIDGHLLGFRVLLRPLSGESSALFEDNLSECSTCWKLSISALSAGLLFKGTGFGATYEDGYGTNCMLNSHLPLLLQTSLRKRHVCWEGGSLYKSQVTFSL